MQSEVRFLDLPIKYAFSASMFFAISAYFFCFILEFLAIFSLGMANQRASWDAIHALGGFDGFAVLRVFVFYLLSFVALSCLERAPARQSPWLPLGLLGALPGVMSFLPFVFSGEFHGSATLALAAMLMGLLFLGASHKSGTFQGRALFLAVLLAILVVDTGGLASAWFDVVYKEAVGMFGADAAGGKAFEIGLYFVPAGLAKAAMLIYLVYVVPLRFVRELRQAPVEE